jgi:iron(III) transport system substrate-binding protein
MKRRVFLAAGGALLGGVARAAPSPEVIDITPDLIAAARSEGRLLVRYSSPVDEMGEMARAFEARFGIKVQSDRKVGVVGTQLFATEERAGKHVMDVNFGGDPAGLHRLGDEGLYLRFTLANLDARLDRAAYLPSLGYSPRWSDIVLSYNPDLIPHARAQSLFTTWEGLLDPSLKGRIGITEPAGGGVAFALMLMFYRLPQYGRAFVQKLAAQNPRLYPGSAPGREDLDAGAISVFIPNWEAVAMVETLKGGRSAWTYPEVLPGFANGYLSISANAPHPAAARLFTAWFFTPEGAKAVEASQNRPTLKGVPDDRAALPVLRRTDWWKPFPEERRWVPDMQDWEQNYADLLPDMRATLGWRR